MKRSCVLAGTVAVVLVTTQVRTPWLFAATAAAGTISPDSPAITWAGRPWTGPNPVTCFSINGTDPTCDRFALTIVPPRKDFVVTIRVTAANATDQVPPTDDIDLYVRDPGGNTIAMSGTSGGIEEVVLNNPPGGTYVVVVQPFLVFPPPVGPGTYSGFAALGTPAHDELSNSYNGALFTANFVGVPNSTPARSSPLVPQLKVSFNYVGRRAA